MAKSPSEVPADASAAYDKLVTAHGKAERKGAAMPYTSVNGHMFSFLTKAGVLALRLPPDERAAFLKKHKTQLCEQHGTVLEEYVEVPAGLLKKLDSLKPYFEVSYNYVAALKPKPTREEEAKEKVIVKSVPK